MVRRLTDKPSVSLANLPQLTIDLIIHSLNLTLHGYVGIGDTVVPLIGKGQGGLRTGGLEGMSVLGVLSALGLIEVYTNDETDIVVVQQRSPVLKVNLSFFPDSSFYPYLILSLFDPVFDPIFHSIPISFSPYLNGTSVIIQTTKCHQC